MSGTLKRKTEEFQRQQLAEILSRVTDEQRQFFHKVFPKGVPSEDICSAYDLCERTIRKNEAGRNLTQGATK